MLNDLKSKNVELSIEEFISMMDSDDVIVLDIRSEIERSHGLLQKSVAISSEELISKPPIDKNKNYIICCSRGETSYEIANDLQNKGLDNFYSLKGGYASYVLYIMRKANSKNNSNDVNGDNEIKDNVDSKNSNELLTKIEKSINTKFRIKLMSNFLKAIKNYELINENDKIAVCISGGKDSFLMAMLFRELKKWTKINFDVEYIAMDPGYNEVNRQLLEENAKAMDIPIKIFDSDIFDIVYNEEKSPCYLCARMRRGHLYSFAKSLSCNKIALAHHYDDVIETILMGMLYGGQMQSMLPKLKSTNFEGMQLIRPMYLIREDDIKMWRDYNNLHFLQCACKFTDTCTSCNNNENKSKRQEVKSIIKKLKETNPYIESNIFKSAENVQLDTLISYKSNGKKHSFLEDFI